MTEKDEKLRNFVDAEAAKRNLMTGKQVADFANVSEATIQRIRAGRSVKTGTACQIVAAFGKTLEEVLGDDAEPICVGEDILPTVMDNFSRVFSEYKHQSEQVQAKLTNALELIAAKDEQIEHLTSENSRILKSYYRARIWAIACAVGIGTLLVVIIAILIYDFTHLDRGWITTFFRQSVQRFVELLH